MVFRISIFLLFSFFVNTAFAEKKVSSNEFVEKLISAGELSEHNVTTISAFNASCTEVPLVKSTTANLQTFCDVVLSSKICKDVKKKDLLDCKKLGEPPGNFSSTLDDCVVGALIGGIDFFLFIWDILKSIWNGAKHPEKTYQEASEFVEFVKLYLTSEYDKAYNRGAPPSKAKAVAAVSGNIIGMLVKGIKEYAQETYQEFGCLHVEAQMEKFCEIAAQWIAPVAVYVKLPRLGGKITKQVIIIKK